MMSFRGVRVKPPTPKAEETRRRILQAALDLFSEKGFAETTMRDIAQKADCATVAAYYYFPSKESIVMAFYWETHMAFDASYRGFLEGVRDLDGRIRILVERKLDQFEAYRSVLGALFRSAGDPLSPLSPFSAETADIRKQSIEHFREALDGSGVKQPADLKPHLPMLLWLYQLGIVLFWIYDRSARQTRTRVLLEKSSVLVARAIGLSRFAVVKPFRASVVKLLESLGGTR